MAPYSAGRRHSDTLGLGMRKRAHEHRANPMYKPSPIDRANPIAPQNTARPKRPGGGQGRESAKFEAACFGSQSAQPARLHVPERKKTIQTAQHTPQHANHNGLLYLLWTSTFLKGNFGNKKRFARCSPNRTPQTRESEKQLAGPGDGNAEKQKKWKSKNEETQ